MYKTVTVPTPAVPSPSVAVKSANTLDTEATNVGATDIQVLADFTGANGDGTTGAATVTVLYMQNNSIQDAVDL